VAVSPPAVLLVVSPSDHELYPIDPPTTIAVHTAHDAMQLIEQARPRVLMLDWDYLTEAPIICRAATAHPSTLVMITTQSATHVPAALKAGCQAVLLKPFPPNLLAARLGRLSRDQSHLAPHGLSALQHGRRRQLRLRRIPAVVVRLSRMRTRLARGAPGGTGTTRPTLCPVTKIVDRRLSSTPFR
jgi:DNA-binding response OmpR family regulator